MSPAEKKAIQNRRKAHRKANKTATGSAPAPAATATVPPTPVAPVPATVPVPTPVPASVNSTVSTLAPSVQDTQANHTALTPSQTNAQRLLSLTDSQPSSVVLNGRTYMASVTHITYRINRTVTINNQRLSLIDRGANGLRRLSLSNNWTNT